MKAKLDGNVELLDTTVAAPDNNALIQKANELVLKLNRLGHRVMVNDHSRRVLELRIGNLYLPEARNSQAGMLKFIREGLKVSEDVFADNELLEVARERAKDAKKSSAGVNFILKLSNPEAKTNNKPYTISLQGCLAEPQHDT